MRAIVPALAAIAALVVVPVGGGAQPVARIIDRTLVCKTIGVGAPDPIGFVDVKAYASNRPQSRGAHVSNDPNVYVGVSIGPHGEPYRGGQVTLIPRGCTQTRLRVPLTTAGLRGGVIGRFGKDYKCEAPTRILVRVRAVFTRPARFVPDSRYPKFSLARGTVTSGYLAVRTPQGRPIAFASAHYARGAVRLFVAPSRCVEQY